MTPEDEPSKPAGAQYATGKSRGQLLIALERMKGWAKSGNDAQLWMCLGGESKADAVNNNTA